MNSKTSLVSISELTPYLYLSGFGCICEPKIKKLGITHIVDSTNMPNPKMFADVKYLFVPVDDSDTARIEKYFKETVEFVKEAKDNNQKCLIICGAGVSRSATLSIVSLMHIQNISLRNAYLQINAIRPIISPNIGFWRKMIEYETSLNGQATVQLLKGMKKPFPNVYLQKC
uniref:Tyrosine-protein phosphatase domain-containing protein n=1 Tax=Rhabditophanes sp. KR3021 TaxID=114890 RepID=A0AC35UC08_9BILA